AGPRRRGGAPAGQGPTPPPQGTKKKRGTTLHKIGEAGPRKTPANPAKRKEAGKNPSPADKPEKKEEKKEKKKAGATPPIKKPASPPAQIMKQPAVLIGAAAGLAVIIVVAAWLIIRRGESRPQGVTPTPTQAPTPIVPP